MTMPYAHAPHQGTVPHSATPAAPNAALLIDFDNVTMGMKSDLGRDLKKLLQSDVIRGKVTVQRAYADWRRYPQYIVPLSENSVDLIFAPAYGSSKKNATDIRMAIDAVELVFTRPEIGTFILLTGDSDFSSCVLKLKEYGKYVIGVGIQESSSDILVQNCDEYYSYNSLAGLQKTTDGDQRSADPWKLVEMSVKRMEDRDDVMRSDRLKQVMIEIDSTFDEGSFGFSKFSKFLTEAASRGLVKLSKMENGQYEIASTGGGGGGGRSSSSSGSSRRERDRDRDEDRGRSRGRGRGRGRSRDRDEDRDEDRGRDEPEAPKAIAEPTEKRVEESTKPEMDPDEPILERREDPAAPGVEPAPDDLKSSYQLMAMALASLKDDDRYPARDSDVKRRMLEISEHFDEGAIGFGKFSLFLKQADEDGVIDLHRTDGGNYEVTVTDGHLAAIGRVIPGAMAPIDDEAATGEDGQGRSRSEIDEDDASAASAPPAPRSEMARSDDDDDDDDDDDRSDRGPVVQELRPEELIDDEAPGRRLGPRGGTTRRRSGEDAPPSLFEGQGRPASGSDDDNDDDGLDDEDDSNSNGEGREIPMRDGDLDMEALGLPTDAESQIRYLTNSYKGVGKKTAEQLIDAFGEKLFDGLQNEPDRVRELLPAGRADQLLSAWQDDLERRLANGGNGRGRGRRGGRGRGGRGRSRG